MIPELQTLNPRPGYIPHTALEILNPWHGCMSRPVRVGAKGSSGGGEAHGEHTTVAGGHGAARDDGNADTQGAARPIRGHAEAGQRAGQDTGDGAVAQRLRPLAQGLSTQVAALTEEPGKPVGAGVASRSDFTGNLGHVVDLHSRGSAL